MDTFVDFNSAIDGHSLVINLTNVTQINAIDQFSSAILFTGEDACNVNGDLREVMVKIHEAQVDQLQLQNSLTQ